MIVLCNKCFETIYNFPGKDTVICPKCNNVIYCGSKSDKNESYSSSSK